MKRKFALLLAVLFVFALFAGCDGGGTTTSTATPTAEPTDNGGEATPSPEPEGPYNLAAGKYEVDADGFPTGTYDYELPLSTNADEVFTYWTSCLTPQAIAEEGIDSMPFQSELALRTGVNIEYQLIPFDTRQQNFATLLAADDLSDMIASGIYFYPGTPKNAVEEGFFANLYDYREYMPNYMYQAVRFADDVDVYNTMFYDDSTITTIYSMLEEPMIGSNYCARGDWLSKLGVDPVDVTTYDEVHDMLTRFKTELDVPWPMEIFKSVELLPAMFFGGYDTGVMVTDTALPAARAVDGNALFTMSQPEDLDALTLLVQWYSEGLIDPGWTGYTSTQAMANVITTDVTGYCPFNPGEISGFETSSTNPDCEWVALTRPRQTEGQILQYGGKVSHFAFGATNISAKCENIPLVATWCDYHYSPEGSFFTSYGVEGVTWEYNDDGEIRLTDFVLHNQDGLGPVWVLLLYSANTLVECGLEQHVRSYAFDGGDRLLDMMRVTWNDTTYEGNYDWPRSLKFTDDQTTELNGIQTDVITYLNETYLSFVDGSKPLSEWDAYVQGLNDIGLARCQEIYQEAYEAFIA